MMLTYVTSNSRKFNSAVIRLAKYDIEIQQKKLDLIEIQSDSVHEIARHKAQSAYYELQTPLIITDVNWSIPALNGFPGGFMAYIDRWLTTDDFLRLMQGIEDRRVILTIVISYIDGTQHKQFEGSVEGVVLHQGGETDFKSFDPIASFRSDKKSFTQARSENLPTFDNPPTLWDDFAQWYLTIV